MSIVLALYKQSLVAERNNLQYGLLRNWSAQRSLLRNAPSFTGAANIGNNLELSGLNDSIQLMAVNAELNALNNINYLA